MKSVKKFFVAAAAMVAVAGSAGAALESQYGILDLAANGGINPNTGIAWADGDQYRLSFYTVDTIAATSNDPAVYDAFATAQAQQNAALAASTGWTALVWVNTDPLMAQGDALSSPADRAGITDVTGGEVIGGAGVPIYAMDGTTSIARNNAVIMSGALKTPFANVDSGWGANGEGADSAVRLPVGATTATNTQNVHYSPFLDQFGSGDSGSQHGTSLMTGGFPGSHVNALGAASDDVSYSWGSSNANNTGRVWNRFTEQNLENARGVYTLSELLTVSDGAGIPADFDGDGFVTNADIAIGISNFTGPQTDPPTFTKDGTTGDTDGDGDDDNGDLATVISSFTGPGPAPVPEPASLALLGLGGLLIARRRRA